MPETYEVGSVKCTPLNDGHFNYPASWFFSNVEPAHLQAELRKCSLDPDRIVSPYTCLLIDTGSHKVLVDTGAGDFAPTTGRLSQALNTAGVRSEEIDTVILTHGHLDHIGGNVDAEGGLAFKNARYIMSKADWEFWTADPIDLSKMNVPEEIKSALISAARRHLSPLRQKVELVEREIEVVPDVHAVPAPGHTPGHIAVLVSSGQEQFLNLADSVLHPLHLAHSDWGNVFDLVPEVAADTRRKLLDRAAVEDLLVMGFHFPGSGAGRITSRGVNRWEWAPLPPGSVT